MVKISIVILVMKMYVTIFTLPIKIETNKLDFSNAAIDKKRMYSKI